MSRKASVSSEHSKVPTFDQLMWPTLCALKDMGGSASHAELLDKIIEMNRIPEEIQSVPHTDGRKSKLSYNLYWAKTYLSAVGAIESTSRGIWAITAKGRTLTEEEVRRIPAEVRRAHKVQRPRATADSKAKESETESQAWRDKLLDALSSMQPEAFERLCQRVLRESGFLEVAVKGRSGDGGIDGVGVLRIASLLSFQVYFQRKRWKNSIPASAIRDFRGAMVGRTDKGLFMTTATFTADAQKEATRDGAPPIDLVDGDQLCDILKNLKMGVAVTTRTVDEVAVDPTWFAQV